MTVPQGTAPRGLLAFKTVTSDPHNSHTLRLVFNERVSKLHKAQLLSALQSWVRAQQLVQQHGRTPTLEEAVGLITASRNGT